MKCQEASKLFVACLDNEVTPSEKLLIQAHLAECGACQQEMAVLAALQGRVSQSLKTWAAPAAPSSQAWSRLHSRLAREVHPSLSWFPAWFQRSAPDVGRINSTPEKGAMKMKRRYALAAMAVLLIAFGTLAFAPSVRAQVSEIFNTWFRFEFPGGEAGFGSSNPIEFTLFKPTYLPEEVQDPGGFVIGGATPENFELLYYKDKQFVAITQSKAPADRALPAGQEVAINDQPAALATGLEGTIDLPHSPESEPLQIAYTDAQRLTWYVGDTRIEMLSNLPESEMLKVATSFVSAQAGEGEQPPLPPFFPPDEEQENGEGGGLIEPSP